MITIYATKNRVVHQKVNIHIIVKRQNVLYRRFVVNLNGLKRKAYENDHMTGPDSNSDAYTNLAPNIDTNTGETTPEKDKYEGVPGGKSVPLTTLFKIYPGLKDSLKKVWKQFQRVNWNEVKTI